MMHRLELLMYCERHGYKVLEQYTTTGEERAHMRARVLTGEGEVHYLYWDSSRRRRSLARQQRDLAIYNAGGIPEPPRVRGWRNTTLDNRKARERTRQHHQRLAEPGCNGLCNPDHCLYEGQCSIHGLAVIIEGLSHV